MFRAWLFKLICNYRTDRSIFRFQSSSIGDRSIGDK